MYTLFFKSLSKLFGKLLLTLVISCSIPSISLPQQQAIDSLLSVVDDQSIHDTTLGIAYLNLHSQFTEFDLDSALAYCELANDISKKNLKKNQLSDAEKERFQSIRAASLNNIGYILKKQGSIEEALSIYRNSLDIHRKINDKNGISITLANIAAIHSEQGNISQALDFYHQALKIQKQVQHQKAIAVTLNNIGYIHKEYGDISVALQYYLESLQIRTEIGYKKGISISLNNIGRIYHELGDLKKALDYHKKSLTIKTELDDKRGISISLFSIGILYEELGDIQEALDFYLQSFDIAEENNLTLEIPTLASSIAKLYLEIGNLSLSEKYATKGLMLSKQLQFPENVMNASKVLSSIYERKGNYKLALEMQRLYANNEDSVKNEKNQRAVIQSELRTKYEKEILKDSLQYVHDINILTKEKEVQSARTQTIGIAFALFAITGIFFSLFMRQKAKQKQNILQIQVENSQQQLQDFTRQLIERSKQFDRLSAEFDDLKKEQGKELDLEKINELTSSKILTEEDWSLFKEKFLLVHKNFFIKLKTKHPNITPGEERLIALEKLNLKTGEIASILGISQDSVTKTRYRLKKKLDISKDVSLIEFIDA